MRYCLRCDFVGQPEQFRPGRFRVEVGLWLFFLVPGVIYFIERQSADSSGLFYSIGRLLARYMPATLQMEVALGLLFLLPGLIYSIWRLSARYQGCAHCGSARIVPLDSPSAQAALSRLSPTPSVRSWVCMGCGVQIFSGGWLCASCEAKQAKERG